MLSVQLETSEAMCSTRKETKRKCKLRGRKTAKSQQTRPFVSLTSCSLMVSVTACCPMKKEKREKRKSCTATVTVCVCRARGLPDLPQPVGETERDQLRAMQKGGGGGAAAEKSEVVPPFPVTRETNALSKKHRPMANTGNCVRTKSHMTAKTPLPMHRVRREEEEKKKLWGWRVIKRRKIERQGQEGGKNKVK